MRVAALFLHQAVRGKGEKGGEKPFSPMRFSFCQQLMGSCRQPSHYKFTEKVSSSHLIRTVTIRQCLQLVHANLIQALDAFQRRKREHLSSIELERGICCMLGGEVGGQRLILIKRARLIVFGNPVCHGRCAEKSLWHSLTYGLAGCLPIQCLPAHALHSWPSSQRLVFPGSQPPAPIQLAPRSTNRLPNLQACLGYSK